MIPQPKVRVGIIDQQNDVQGFLYGTFLVNGRARAEGPFLAKVEKEEIVLLGAGGREIIRSSSIRLKPDLDATWKVSHVTIGKSFHWEKTEDQLFEGDLILHRRPDGTLVTINEIPVEDYLISVISSEMNPAAPTEFLLVHTILSRSWILAALDPNKKGKKVPELPVNTSSEEVVRWTSRESHDLFDVCADDHCQRYHGIEKITSEKPKEVVQRTHGTVMIYQGEICDARYSKCCGGLTDEFHTAWEDRTVHYLTSVSDTLEAYSPIRSEEEAERWILSNPNAHCNVRERDLLRNILREGDRETETFFRWKVEYGKEELGEILREKSGLDFGTLQEIIPLHRGPSGRISKLKIVGSQRSIVVGKELEIRRWLSKSHLYSSAFVVAFERDRVILHGAGWGHGVGLCQIGAAMMAAKGYSAEEILRHYFPGVEIRKIY